MKLPLLIALKDFFGIYAITPFEKALLDKLSDALMPDEREILTYQLAKFTSIDRYIHDGSVFYSFTEFHTRRFFRYAGERQTKRFASSKPSELLAIAHVIFDGGEIEAKFWLGDGVLFSIHYHSLQRIYYPPDDYCIESIIVHPKATAPNISTSCDDVREINEDINRIANVLLAAGKEFRPCSIVELRSLEAELGVSLPVYLRDWFLVVGYGSIGEELYCGKEYSVPIEDGRLIGGAIFATDACANYYIFDNSGKIYFLNPSGPDFAFISNNFLEFMEELTRRNYKLDEWMSSIKTQAYE